MNACGNDVTIGGGFNSASDNTCANVSEGSHGSHGGKKSSDRSADPQHEASYGGSHSESGGAHAVGAAKGSPGVLSGNLIQAPIHVPVNACGNSLNLVGLFNEASDNTCVNVSGHHEEKEPEKEPEKTPEKDKPEPPVKVKTPPTPVEPPAVDTPGSPPHLAETGTDGLMAASAAGAVLLTGGALLYRRGRVGARR